MPPRPVFKLLLGLHPTLRRRARAASRALADRAWAREPELWRGGLRERFRAEVRRLQTVDPRSLDDAGLRAHLDEVVRLFRDGIDIHFRHVVANLIAVGDFLGQAAEWTGAEPRLPSAHCAALGPALPRSRGSIGSLRQSVPGHTPGPSC